MLHPLLSSVLNPDVPVATSQVPAPLSSGSLKPLCSSYPFSYSGLMWSQAVTVHQIPICSPHFREVSATFLSPDKWGCQQRGFGFLSQSTRKAVCCFLHPYFFSDNLGSGLWINQNHKTHVAQSLSHCTKIFQQKYPITLGYV